MMFLEKSLFNFYDIITRFIIMTLKPTETKTQCLKNQPKWKLRKNRNRFGQISVSSTSTRLQLSAVIQTTRTGTTVCKLVETWVFLLPWKCINFHAKHTGLWQCMNNMVPSNETRLYWSCCRTLHLLTVQAFSVLKYFHSNYSLLQNYISGRKEAVHIKYVSDLGLRLKLGTF